MVDTSLLFIGKNKFLMMGNHESWGCLWGEVSSFTPHKAIFDMIERAKSENKRFTTHFRKSIG